MTTPLRSTPLGDVLQPLRDVRQRLFRFGDTALEPILAAFDRALADVASSAEKGVTAGSSDVLQPLRDVPRYAQKQYWDEACFEWHENMDADPTGEWLKLADVEPLVSALRQELESSNSVCACGCPESDHENYGEDGESCEHEEHQCVRTNRAVLSMLASLRADVLRLTEELEVAVLLTRQQGDLLVRLLRIFEPGVSSRIPNVDDVEQTAQALIADNHKLTEEIAGLSQALVTAKGIPSAWATALDEWQGRAEIAEATAARLTEERDEQAEMLAGVATVCKQHLEEITGLRQALATLPIRETNDKIKCCNDCRTVTLCEHYHACLAGQTPPAGRQEPEKS